MDILLLLVGLALIIGGANYLTDGASALAQRLRMPEFLIGLTIVAIGTSMPELVVSVLSSINGKPDMALGNVVGSNLFNVLLILGICALVRPIFYSRDNIRYDIPFGVLTSVLLLFMASDALLGFGVVNQIGRADGALMFTLYIALMIFTIRHAKRAKEEEELQPNNRSSVWLIALMIIGGLGGLIYGGDLFLDSATNIARALGISESVIAITLVAGGTSLPELASALVSLIKGKAEMALGNVIGSNIANILLILGLSSLIHPLSMGGITHFDLLAVLLSSILLMMTAYTFRRSALDRSEGALFIALYIGYIYLLIA